MRLDQAALDELTERLTAATGDGSGAVLDLVDTLRAHGDDRLAPLLEVLWPDGAHSPVPPGAGLVQALGARDPGAAFDAAFGVLMDEVG